MSPAIPERLFELDSQSSANLQSQIQEMLVKAILDGQIPAGSAMPSGRKFAEQLKVARNTVVLVYQRLVDEGFLVARERSGYFVNDDILLDRLSPTKDTEVAKAPLTGAQNLDLHPVSNAISVNRPTGLGTATRSSTGRSIPACSR